MFERGRKDGVDTAPGTTSSENPSASSGAATRDTGTGTGTGTGTTAVIGRSIQIDGDLRGEEDLRIEGEVSGTIHLKNNSLTIGSQGKIKADVYAKAIVVDGSMEGDLYGSERVAIRKNAQVVGNVTAPRVSLDDGARFKGSIEMDQQAVDSALGTSRTSKSQPTAIETAKNEDRNAARAATGSASAQKESTA